MQGPMQNRHIGALEWNLGIRMTTGTADFGYQVWLVRSRGTCLRKESIHKEKELVEKETFPWLVGLLMPELGEKSENSQFHRVLSMKAHLT